MCRFCGAFLENDPDHFNFTFAFEEAAKNNSAAVDAMMASRGKQA